MSSMAIGFDVGGTKIAYGVVDSDGVILHPRQVISTPNRPAEMLETMRATTVRLKADNPAIIAIGVGAAGLVERPDGYIRWAPNNSYHEMPLQELLTQATGLPTIVDNDANAAAWAEAKSSSSAQYMMFLTVGTGVGGGLVLGGRMYRGCTGVGGEVGHIIVDAHGGSVCGCGNMGCLEAVASGTALGRYGREAAALNPSGMLASLAGGIDRVTGETVFTAARAGDPDAIRAYQIIGEWLGIGVASIVAVLDLERIVVGGGVAQAGELVLSPLCASLDANLFARDKRRVVPQVVLARHGVDAGWMGAALIALDSV